MEMLSTIELIPSERFSGSRSFFSRRSVLNCMKSVWLSSIYLRKSLAVCLRAKESGSSPSSSRTTLTFSPSARNRLMPRRAAWMPAESPSYIMVAFSVNLWMRRICSTVSEVPHEATTFVMPS